MGVLNDCGAAASGQSKPESSTILLGVAMEGPGFNPLIEDGLGVAALVAGLAGWKDGLGVAALAAQLVGRKDEGPGLEDGWKEESPGLELLASLILFELSSSSSSSTTTLARVLGSFCGRLANASSKLKLPIFTQI